MTKEIYNTIRLIKNLCWEQNIKSNVDPKLSVRINEELVKLEGLVEELGEKK